MRIIFLIIISMLLSSCFTNLNDFQEMSRNERSEFVCVRDDGYKEHYRYQTDVQSKVDNSLNVLSRGYRVHKSCRNVAVKTPGKVSCTTIGIYTDCKQKSNTTYEKRCTETPVSIDATLERSNLDKLERLLQSAKKSTSKSYNDCYYKIKSMSAERAFNYYDK
jgi:hypothetical protein